MDSTHKGEKEEWNGRDERTDSLGYSVEGRKDGLYLGEK